MTATHRVRTSAGAALREGIALDSPQLTTLPKGTLVVADAIQTYSEGGIERARLSLPLRGWVSLKCLAVVEPPAKFRFDSGEAVHRARAADYSFIHDDRDPLLTPRSLMGRAAPVVLPGSHDLLALLSADDAGSLASSTARCLTLEAQAARDRSASSPLVPATPRVRGAQLASDEARDPGAAATLRWMVQKAALGQNMFLVDGGGGRARRLVARFCAMTRRELEHTSRG